MAESERIAIARFNNYDAATFDFTMTVTAGDQDLTIEGRADMPNHYAVGTITTADAPPTTGLLTWNLETVALLPTASLDPIPATLPV